MSLKKIYDRLSSETQSEFREAMREEIKASEEEILYAKKNLDGWLEDIEVMQFQVEGWLKHLISLLRRTSNNFNQIARRVNSTNRVYENDIQEMKTMLEQLWEANNSILEKLAAID